MCCDCFVKFDNVWMVEIVGFGFVFGFDIEEVVVVGEYFVVVFWVFVCLCLGCVFVLFGKVVWVDFLGLLDFFGEVVGLLW